MTLSHCTTPQQTALLADTSHATKSALRTALSNLVSFVTSRVHRRLQRTAFRKLLVADDRILKDIGVTRGDVYWASELPMEINAGEELRLHSLRYPRQG